MAKFAEVQKLFEEGKITEAARLYPSLTKRDKDKMREAYPALVPAEA